jgi:hypothetical protein
MRLASRARPIWRSRANQQVGGRGNARSAGIQAYQKSHGNNAALLSLLTAVATQCRDLLAMRRLHVCAGWHHGRHIALQNGALYLFVSSPLFTHRQTEHLRAHSPPPGPLTTSSQFVNNRYLLDALVTSIHTTPKSCATGFSVFCGVALTWWAHQKEEVKSAGLGVRFHRNTSEEGATTSQSIALRTGNSPSRSENLDPPLLRGHRESSPAHRDIRRGDNSPTQRQPPTTCRPGGRNLPRHCYH